MGERICLMRKVLLAMIRAMICLSRLSHVWTQLGWSNKKSFFWKEYCILLVHSKSCDGVIESGKGLSAMQSRVIGFLV